MRSRGRGKERRPHLEVELEVDGEDLLEEEVALKEDQEGARARGKIQRRQRAAVL